jgi:hypothetical protein
MTITLTDGGKVAVTSEHPFYTPDRGWVESGNLKVGDKLLQRTGQTIIVSSITHQQTTTTVYNFSVENDHNYYVGASSLLVHNCLGISVEREMDLDRRLSDAAKTKGVSRIGSATREEAEAMGRAWVGPGGQGGE